MNALYALYKMMRVLLFVHCYYCECLFQGNDLCRLQDCKMNFREILLIRFLIHSHNLHHACYWLNIILSAFDIFIMEYLWFQLAFKPEIFSGKRRKQKAYAVGQILFLRYEISTVFKSSYVCVFVYSLECSMRLVFFMFNTLYSVIEYFNH